MASEPTPTGRGLRGTHNLWIVYGVAMTELIKRPSVTVSRQLVETALLRLVRYPGTTSVRNVMRVVDEYAASLYTNKVYLHAERVVGEALIEAAYAKQLGKKIFVEIDGVENFSDDYVKNFYAESTWKKFLSDLLSEADRVSIMVSDPSPTCPTSPESTICRECQECPECSLCPVCRNTPVRDTSDKGTLATLASGAVTDVPDTRDSVTGDTDKGGLATVPSDSRPAVTAVTDKGGLATACPDTTDSGPAALDVSTPTTVTPAPNVDMATYESGKSEPDAGAPDAPAAAVADRPDAVAADGVPVKGCTQCKRVLALSCYGRNRSRPDGRASACQECEMRRNRERREAKRQEAAQDGQKRPSEHP